MPIPKSPYTGRQPVAGGDVDKPGRTGPIPPSPYTGRQPVAGGDVGATPPGVGPISVPPYPGGQALGGGTTEPKPEREGQREDLELAIARSLYEKQQAAKVSEFELGRRMYYDSDTGKITQERTDYQVFWDLDNKLFTLEETPIPFLWGMVGTSDLINYGRSFLPSSAQKELFQKGPIATSSLQPEDVQNFLSTLMTQKTQREGIPSLGILPAAGPDVSLMTPVSDDNTPILAPAAPPPSFWEGMKAVGQAIWNGVKTVGRGIYSVTAPAIGQAIGGLVLGDKKPESPLSVLATAWEAKGLPGAFSDDPQKTQYSLLKPRVLGGDAEDIMGLGAGKIVEVPVAPSTTFEKFVWYVNQGAELFIEQTASDPLTNVIFRTLGVWKEGIEYFVSNVFVSGLDKIFENLPAVGATPIGLDPGWIEDAKDYVKAQKAQFDWSKIKQWQAWDIFLRPEGDPLSLATKLVSPEQEAINEEIRSMKGVGIKFASPENKKNMKEKIYAFERATEQAGEDAARLRSAARAMFNSAVTQEDYETALAVMRQAIDLDFKYGWKGLNPMMAHSWSSEAERLEDFLDALALAELQAGRPLTRYEIWRIRSEYTVPGIEFVGEVAFDYLNLIPSAVFGLVSDGIGGLWKAGKTVLRAGENLPILGDIIKMIDSAAVKSASIKLGNVAAEVFGDIGRGSKDITDYSRRAMKFGSLLDDYKAGKIAEAELREGLKEVSPFLGRKIDKILGSEKVPSMIQTIEPKLYESMVTAGTERALQNSIDNLIQNASKYRGLKDLDDMARALGKGLGLSTKIGDSAALTKLAGEIGEEAATDVARKLAGLQKAASDYIVSTGLASTRVSDPMGLVRGISDQFKGAFVDSMRAWPGSRLVRGQLTASIGMRFPGLRRALDGWDEVVGFLRGVWIRGVLATRPGWVAINYVDSTFRFLIGGGSLLDSTTNVVNQLLRDGFSLRDLEMRFFPEQTGDLLQGMTARFAQGTPPGISELLGTPFHYIGRGLKKLTGKDPFQVYSLKSWTGVIYDYQDAIEYSLRVRLFYKKIYPTIQLLDPIAMEKMLVKVPENLREHFMKAWREAGANGQRFEDIINSLAMPGSRPGTAFIPEELLVTPLGHTVQSQRQVIQDMTSQLDALFKSAADRGVALTEDDLTKFFDDALDTLKKEYGEIRKAREALMNSDDGYLAGFRPDGDVTDVVPPPKGPTLDDIEPPWEDVPDEITEEWLEGEIKGGKVTGRSAEQQATADQAMASKGAFMEAGQSKIINPKLTPEENLSLQWKMLEFSRNMELMKKQFMYSGRKGDGLIFNLMQPRAYAWNSDLTKLAWRRYFAFQEQVYFIEGELFDYYLDLAKTVDSLDDFDTALSVRKYLEQNGVIIGKDEKGKIFIEYVIPGEEPFYLAGGRAKQYILEAYGGDAADLKFLDEPLFKWTGEAPPSADFMARMVPPGASAEALPPSILIGADALQAGRLVDDLGMLTKPPWKMTKKDFDSLGDLVKETEARTLNEIFGEEGAVIYRQAKAVALGTAETKGVREQARRLVEDMEVILSPDQAMRLRRILAQPGRVGSINAGVLSSSLDNVSRRENLLGKLSSKSTETLEDEFGTMASFLRHRIEGALERGLIDENIVVDALVLKRYGDELTKRGSTLLEGASPNSPVGVAAEFYKNWKDVLKKSQKSWDAAIDEARSVFLGSMDPTDPVLGAEKVKNIFTSTGSRSVDDLLEVVQAKPELFRPIFLNASPEVMLRFEAVWDDLPAELRLWYISQPSPPPIVYLGDVGGTFTKKTVPDSLVEIYVKEKLAKTTDPVERAALLVQGRGWMKSHAIEARATYIHSGSIFIWEAQGVSTNTIIHESVHAALIPGMIPLADRVLIEEKALEMGRKLLDYFLSQEGSLETDLAKSIKKIIGASEAGEFYMAKARRVDRSFDALLGEWKTNLVLRQAVKGLGIDGIKDERTLLSFLYGALAEKLGVWGDVSRVRSELLTYWMGENVDEAAAIFRSALKTTASNGGLTADSLMEKIGRVAALHPEDMDEVWKLWATAEDLATAGYPPSALSSFEEFRAYMLKRAKEASEDFGRTSDEVEAILWRLNRAENMMGYAASQLEPDIIGLLPPPLATYNMKPGTFSWLLTQEFAGTEYDLIRDGFLIWRDAFLDMLRRDDIFLRTLTDEEKSVLLSLAKEGAELKKGIADVATHGGLTDLLPGVNFDGAMNFVNRTMLDYGDFSDFDQLMRGIYPFWMFPSRSIPYWLETLAANPEIVTAYNKYILYADRTAYQMGAVNSKGEVLPSLRGRVRIPGTDIWFNPTAPLSFRYVLPSLYTPYRDEEAEAELGMVKRVVRWLYTTGSARGFSVPPWITALLYWGDVLDRNEDPPMSIFPVAQLLPPYWQRSVTSALRSAFNPAGNFAANWLWPEVSWEDYLIERRLLANTLEQISNPNLTEEAKYRIALDACKALGGLACTADHYLEDWEEGSREQNSLWLKTRDEIQNEDYYLGMAGFFTGIYGRIFTDADINLLSLRTEVDLLKVAVNSQLLASVFDLDEDASERYNFYIENTYNTPPGYIYNLYQNIRWTVSPVDEKTQLYGEDRRELVAQRIMEDSMTEAYYDTIAMQRTDLGECLGKFEIGRGGKDKEGCFTKYFDARSKLETTDMYKAAQRPWVEGLKPKELVLEHYQDLWWYMIKETRPQWKVEEGEEFSEYQARLSEWEAMLPQIGSLLGTVFIKRGQEADWFEQIGPDGEVIPMQFQPQNITAFLEQTNAAGYLAWDMAREGAMEALDRAWYEMYYSQYWISVEGLTGADRELATQDFYEKWPMPPSAEDLIGWVMTNYAPGQFTQKELMDAYNGRPIMSVEERIESGQSSFDKMEDDIWTAMNRSGPLGSEGYDALIDKYIRLGGERDLISFWFTSDGNLEAFGDEEEAKAFYSLLMQAAAKVAPTKPTTAELAERALAEDLNDIYKDQVKTRFGEDIYWLFGYYYGELSYAEQSKFKKESPEAWAKIQSYYEFKDVYAATNPAWAKYYNPDYETPPGYASTRSVARNIKTRSRKRQLSRGGASLRRALRGQGGEHPGGGGVSGAGGGVQMGRRVGGISTVLSGKLGRGGVVDLPSWPPELKSAIGTIAMEQIEEAEHEGTSYPDGLLGFLQKLLERHPEWEPFLKPILDRTGLTEEET